MKWYSVVSWKRVPCGRWYKWFSLVPFKFYPDTENMYQIQYGSVVKHIHFSMKLLGFKPQLHFFTSSMTLDKLLNLSVSHYVHLLSWDLKECYGIVNTKSDGLMIHTGYPKKAYTF